MKIMHLQPKYNNYWYFKPKFVYKIEKWYQVRALHSQVVPYAYTDILLQRDRIPCSRFRTVGMVEYGQRGPSVVVFESYPEPFAA